MGSRKRSGDEPLSVTVQTLGHVAYFFSVPISRVDNWRRGAEPMPGRIREDCWDLKVIFEWWQSIYGGGGDEVTGANSPALERLRSEKAAIEKMKRLQMEHRLLDGDALQETIGVLASIIRQAGERLEREHGIEARETVDEAIDEFERYCRRSFGLGNDSASETINVREPATAIAKDVVVGEGMPSPPPAYDY